MPARNIVRSIARRMLGTGNVADALQATALNQKRFYRRAFTLDDTRDLLTRLGFARGRVVWVQSLGMSFTTFRQNRPT